MSLSVINDLRLACDYPSLRPLVNRNRVGLSASNAYTLSRTARRCSANRVREFPHGLAIPVTNGDVSYSHRKHLTKFSNQGRLTSVYQPLDAAGCADNYRLNGKPWDIRQITRVSTNYTMSEIVCYDKKQAVPLTRGNGPPKSGINRISIGYKSGVSNLYLTDSSTNWN